MKAIALAAALTVCATAAFGEELQCNVVTGAPCQRVIPSAQAQSMLPGAESDTGNTGTLVGDIALPGVTVTISLPPKPGCYRVQFTRSGATKILDAIRCPKDTVGKEKGK